MKVKNRIIYFLIIIFISADYLCAQEVNKQDTLIFSLDKAIEVALNDNQTIKIAEKEIQRVKYSKQEVIGGFIPSIDASGSYTRNIIVPSMFIPSFGSGAVKMGFDNSYNATIQASVPLYSESLIQSLNISKKDIEIALESARSSKISLVSEVKNAYYSILLAKISLQVLEMSFQNSTDNYLNTKQMYENGMAAEYDVIRSEVVVRNLNPLLIQSRDAVTISKLKLTYLLGLPLNIPINIEGSLTDYEQLAQNYVPELNIDLTDNTDLKQLELQKDKMELQLKLTKSQRIPTIGAFINAQVFTQDNTFKFGNYNWRTSSATGLQLNVPIFKGLSVIRQQQQVKVAMDQLDYQYSYLKEGLTVNIKNSITNIKTASEQLESNKLGIILADKGYNIAETRYKTGVGTLLELNDAEVAKVNANLNYNQAIYNFLQAKTEYERILGQYQESTQNIEENK